MKNIDHSIPEKKKKKFLEVILEELVKNPLFASPMLFLAGKTMLTLWSN